MSRLFLPALVLVSACLDYGLEPMGDTPLEGEPTEPAPELVPCEGDLPPEIIAVSPGSDAVFDVGASIELEAWVTDAVTAPEGLQLEWTDDLGALISAPQVDSEGYATTTWSGDRPAGAQVIGLSVTDACGNTVVEEIPVCQQAGYASSELALDSWHLEGDAILAGEDDLLLTSAAPWQIGSAFLADEIVSGGDVSIRFEFLTEGGTGADGISLTALDVDRMTSYLGGHGCGLGYGGGVYCTDGPALPGWSIELDTWYNAELPDPTIEDHVAFTFDGLIAEPEIWSVVPDLEESGWHTVEVVVQAPHVSMKIDGVSYLDAEVVGDFDFPAVIGFTGSTGGETNEHWIRSLTVTELACPDAGGDTIPDEVEDVDTDIDTDTGAEESPDPEEGELESTVVSTSDWGSGWCGEGTVINGGSSATTWSVSVPRDGSIDSYWDSRLNVAGSDWVFSGADWNTVLEPGEQTTFGFCANR